PTEVYVGIRTDGSGELSTEEYDRAVGDLVNYLVYSGEPSKLESHALGIKVMIFLLIFFVLAYFLKKEYWKDVE
ncbi:cytochrome c1, partial [Alishewanella sp. SMS9]|nr:cytochrome c1 [Alishewanella sp. SMS9]